ncbi:MAG: hypothetical protein RQ899_05885 [Pseudomonadales bacterium]|nr:hypothetical protein [Pseudomonadales bacterium]
MSASRQLDQYLEAFRQRLRRLTLLQGAAVTVCVLLLLSVAGAWLATASGFASSTVNLSRLLLILALTATVIRFIVMPLRRLRRGISSRIEARSPGFKGRIQTYLEMKDSNNPFRDLLAEDALRVSASYPVKQQVRQQELNYAGGLTVAAVLLLVYLLIAGPGMLNYSLRNLFAGWALDDLLPPQSIVVTPGDQSVRRGANLRISSAMHGFDPAEAVIHVKSGARDWQQVPMVQGPQGFEFTFFSLQEPMAYYVSASGARSPEFDIQVVDLPAIENLSLTYHYPEWTSREAETIEPGGDIRTLPDTRVELTVTTSAPLLQGELVLNKAGQSLSLDGNQASTEFMVTEEGEYYIAALVGGEQVRLSDDYFIRLTEDGKPVVKVLRPGLDWNASNIEEVLVEVEASDDFGLKNLELKYSVNGAGWQSIDLSQADKRELNAKHLFMLEDIRTTETTPLNSTPVGAFNLVLPDGPARLPATTDATGSAPAPAPEPAVETREVPLVPGDLISYYAEASDRSQTVRTDMFFIQVQPFNRRYSQSQISGGGGGGGGGGPQDEISQRQRQIIVSTWNLIRQQAETGDAATIEINSSLLSELQTTLAEQAQTLVDRAHARQLSRDEQIERFVASMEQAVQAMYPASEKLAAVALDEAIQPAQEALQHLLRAEAVFNEITISQQQGGGGGGGGGRNNADLAEMFELEMDIEKNQYETGNRSSSPQAQAQEAEDIMKQLDELARRQQELANTMRNQQQVTDAQRYQQDMLRREAEKLQERLQSPQQQNQSGQQGQQGQQQAGNQQGQQGQQGQSQSGQQGGQAGASGSGSQSDESGQQQDVAQSELQRRMESAIRAMNESAEAMRGNPSQEQLQRAAEEAQRQLEGARDQVAQEQLASMQSSFNNMAQQSEQMLTEQQRMEKQLQDAMTKAVADRESGDDPNSRGMTLAEEWALAREKQQLAADLQSLQQQMLNGMQRFGQEAPDATRELQRANNDLIENELERTVAESAMYIDGGYGLYIAGNESSVTAGIRRLAESLERAQQLAQGAGTRGNTELDRARQQAQALRNQLQEQLAQARTDGQAGQGQESQNGQSSQQQGQQGGQQGGPGGGGRFGARNGAWDGNADAFDNVRLPEGFYGDVSDLTDLTRAAIAQLNLDPEALARMYDLVRELEYAQVNRNDSIVAQEYNNMLSLIEQLEVSLQSKDKGNSSVRTTVSDVIPDEYKESVAEYYRKLSQD